MPTVQTNGIDMHYTERGEGEPLILIMGLSADGAVWELHAEEFEKHFRCILIDNRGVGQSSKPPGSYTTKQMADDTIGLMDALGINQARVAGVSMGGAIGQQLCIHYPERIRSAILSCTWAKCDNYATNVFEHFKKARAHLRFEDFMQLLQLWIFTKPFYDANLADLKKALGDAAVIETPQPQHGFEGQADACITHDTTGQLDKIKAPVLLTCGKQDIFTPLWMSEHLHENIAGSELFLLDDAGHAHHWEALDKFNSKCVEWLKAH